MAPPAHTTTLLASHSERLPHSRDEKHAERVVVPQLTEPRLLPLAGCAGGSATRRS